MNEPSRFYSTQFLLTLIVVLLCVDMVAETYHAPAALSVSVPAVVLVIVVVRTPFRE